MLTYYRVRSALNSRDALPLNLILSFETTSSDKAEMTVCLSFLFEHEGAILTAGYIL